MDDAVLRKKEQKDVELDKKILALRKKNEALMRRYQVSLQGRPHPCSPWGLQLSVRQSQSHFVTQMPFLYQNALGAGGQSSVF